MSEPASDAAPRREFSRGYRADVLFVLMGDESLRWALVIMKVLPFLAVYHMWIASRHFTAELRESPPAAQTAP